MKKRAVGGKKKISIADPTYLAKKIKILLSGKIISKQLPGQFNATNNCTEFEITLPSKEESGKTFTFDIQ